MDKLNKFLAILKKYQFWFICGFVLITTLAVWWVATMGLAGQFNQRKTKLEGDFKNVVVQPGHPNQDVIDKVREQDKILKQKVFDAWEILYREQKEKNPLPNVKALDDNFKRQFENLKPKEELAANYREDYQNFILLYLPTLLEKADVRRPAEAKPEKPGGAGAKATGAAGGARDAGVALPGGGLQRGMPAGIGGIGGRMMGGGGTGNAEEELIGTVEWNETDYRALEARFEWKETPSTLAVVLAQEDLWVYEALLRVIKNTNEGATSHTTAPVKRIEALQIGADAVQAWKASEETILRTGQGGGGGAAGGPGGMAPGMMGGPGGPGGPGGLGGAAGPGGPGGPGGGRMGMGMDPGMMMGGETPGAAAGGATGGSGDEKDKQRLIEGRYVDDKVAPLTYDAEYPYAKHPYAEFKMMPIRMNLVMDQRRVPKLLVECANSNMPIEVRRIRILKSQSSANEGGGAMAAPTARRGGMEPGGMMPGGRGGMPGGLGGGGGGAVEDKQDAVSLDVPVEIYGVIYIYNPPDREKLGTGTASTEKPAEAAAPGTPATPAPQTPAPVAPPAATPATPPVAPQGPAGTPAPAKPSNP